VTRPQLTRAGQNIEDHSRSIEMSETTSKSRVIPLMAVQDVDSAKQESLTRRLESQGWIRQSTIGEPRLSEMVSTYERLGYEVRIEANQDRADDASASACSSGGSSGCSSGASAGCSGGGCSSGATPVSIDVAPIPEEDDGADLRTIFVRKLARSGN
jgi:hypothetical protein